MSVLLQRFVGRQVELQQLQQAAEQAARGNGSMWLVQGEPGVGKSRLLEELCASLDQDIVVAWGRCSESGGAPPYWPIVQILRGLRRRCANAPLWSNDARASRLATIVPELGPRHPESQNDRTRFDVFDAVACSVCDLAEAQPLLLIVEDLHAADAETLALLEVLALELRTAKVLVLGSYRDGDAARSAHYGDIVELMRLSRVLQLGALAPESARDFLSSALGELASSELLGEALRITEGNALFLVEVARWALSGATHGAAAPSQSPKAPDRPGVDALGPPIIPPAVELIIEERVAHLDADVVDTLRTLSILGRDVDLRIAEHLSKCTRSELDTSLQAAMRAGVLTPFGDRRVRFSHILLCEVLYHGLSESRRAALHGQAADVYAKHGRDAAPAIIAHHALAAGASLGATLAAAQAGRDAIKHCAFEEAVSWYQKALHTCDLLGEDEPQHRFELLLELARAQMLSGDVRTAKETCLTTAAIARSRKSPEMLAKAALAYGAEVVIAEVDDTLISLLEQALAGLGPDEAALRARVMARLAAALQPAADPSGPIDLARQAIGFARESGDEDALIAALRHGTSAMMDVGDPVERSALNREHADLVIRRGDIAEAVRAQSRIAFDGYEIGDSKGAALAIDECEMLSIRLEHPRYRWRAVSFRAMQAAHQARFDDALQLVSEAERLAHTARDESAIATLLMQRLGVARLQMDTASMLDVMSALRPALGSNGFGAIMARLFDASALALAGRLSEATARLDEQTTTVAINTDPSTCTLLADFAISAGDRAIVARLIERLTPIAQRHVSFGMYGMHVEGPIEHLLGRLYRAASQDALAMRALQSARQRVDPDATALVKWIVRDIEAGRQSEADPEPLGSAIPPKDDLVPTVSQFHMKHEGGLWSIECDGETIFVRDVKGLHLLARLCDARGQDLHVLDLMAPTGARDRSSTSDAGEALDETAKRAYRARVADLREELDEAEAYNDPMRAERARGELTAIESELARAVGLGGRTRRDGSNVERARINVQRRLKDAIARIGAEHPKLGRHLTWAIHTGTYCSYLP